MQSDLSELKERVLDTAKKSPVGPQVQAVELEADRDDQGADFLRVTIQLKNGGKAKDADLEALLESIEDAVGAVDERYPSVRFADAA